MGGQGRNHFHIDPALAGQLLQKSRAPARRSTPPVGSVLHHGLEDVGHSQDLRLQRHRFGGQVERVTAAIGLFMVIGGPQGDGLEAVDMAQDLVGLETVGIDDGPLPLISDPALSRISSGTRSLPRSCSNPAISSCSQCPLQCPSARPAAGPVWPRRGRGHGEGTLGIDDGREDPRQLLELAVAGETGFPLAQHVVHVVADGAPLQLQPERLRAGRQRKAATSSGSKNSPAHASIRCRISWVCINRSRHRSEVPPGHPPGPPEK